MTYEKTGSKLNKDTAQNAKEYSLKGIETRTILFVLMKRHKFGLSIALNIVFIVFFFLPFLPSEIAHLISSLV